MTAPVKPKAERAGRCGALRTTGRCACPGWVKGRSDGTWITCAVAGCGHTQQLHAVEAVKP